MLPLFGSGNLIRTDDIPGMNRVLYQLSYAAMCRSNSFPPEQPHYYRNVRKVAPLGDPIEVTVRGYELSLRKADAEMIEVE